MILELYRGSKRCTSFYVYDCTVHTNTRSNDAGCVVRRHGGGVGGGGAGDCGEENRERRRREGVPQDDGEARRLWELAAWQGHVAAQTALSRLGGDQAEGAIPTAAQVRKEAQAALSKHSGAASGGCNRQVATHGGRPPRYTPSAVITAVVLLVVRLSGACTARAAHPIDL